MLTHRVPYPPNRGDRIRSYQLLKYLAERSDVSLACLADEPVDDSTLRYLDSICDRLAVCPTTRIGRMLNASTSLALGRSATEGHFWSAELARTIGDWCRQVSFDAVLCYCSGMFHYVRDCDLSGCPIVVDLVDVDSKKWMDCARQSHWPLQWLYRLESRRIHRVERELAECSKAVTLVSQAETDLFRTICPAAPAHPIRNGVQTEPSVPAKTDDGKTCVFVGVLDYIPNVDGVSWFCRNVWPLVQEKHAEAKFWIVGRRPVQEIRRLARLPGVKVIGEVPDVEPYLRSARLAVVPLRIARGVQNKVLEAMASATPLIASTSALEGCDAISGQHVELAETPAEWVAQIDRLFQDQDARRRLGVAGYRFVSEHHRWNDCLRPMGQLLGLEPFARSSDASKASGARTAVGVN